LLSKPRTLSATNSRFFLQRLQAPREIFFDHSQIALTLGYPVLADSPKSDSRK
jgi:hypothetical protein